MFAGRWFTMVAAAVSLAAGFFITLWLTEPDTIDPVNATANLDPIERLTRSQVYDNASLASAARAAKLVPVDTVRGHIDETSRLPDGQVRMAGWAANLLGDGTPLTVIAFAAGRGTVLGRTDGPRDDVTTDQRLSAAAARHVKIAGLVQCGRREAIVVSGSRERH